MNVAELEAHLDIESLLDHFSIDTSTLRRIGSDEYRIACFVHGSDNETSMSIRMWQGRWYTCCYSHGCINGSLVDALIARGSALRDVVGAYTMCQGESRVRANMGRRTRCADVAYLPDDAMDQFEPAIHRDYIALGLDRDMLLNTFGVRYDTNPNSPLYGRVVYPIRDKMGHICSIQGRRTDACGPDATKYMFMPGYSAKHLLFGHYEMRDMIRGSPYVVVTESPKSVMRGYQLGVATVALMGIRWKEQQAHKLAAMGKRLILVADADEPGINGMHELEYWLRRYIDVRVVVCEGKVGADVSDLRSRDEWMRLLEV